MPDGGVISVPVGLAIAGAVMNKHQQDKAEQAARPVNEAMQQTAIAEAAETKRRTELSKMLEGMFKDRLSTGQEATNLEELLGAYGMSSLKDLPGASNYGDLQAYGRLNRAAMSRNLMGLTGAVGTGTLGQAGQQNFLESSRLGQDAADIGNALADGVMNWVNSRQGPEMQQTTPQNVRVSDLIKPIEEPKKIYDIPPNPF